MEVESINTVPYLMSIIGFFVIWTMKGMKDSITKLAGSLAELAKETRDNNRELAETHVKDHTNHEVRIVTLETTAKFCKENNCK